jgi:hypothetical protein
MDPYSMGLSALGGLAGLFSSPGGYMLPPGYGFANRNIKDIVRHLKAYGLGVPGSGGMFAAQKSAADAGYGDQAAQGREQLLSALGPNAESNLGSADALGRFESSRESGLASLNAGLMQNDVQNRFGALGQAGSMAGSLLGSGPQYMQNPTGDLSSLFGGLASAYTTNNLLKKLQPISGIQQGGGGTPGMSSPGPYGAGNYFPPAPGFRTY